MGKLKSIKLVCTHCKVPYIYEVCHKTFGWCLVCHHMVPCPDCGSMIKIGNWEEFTEAVRVLNLVQQRTGHEHKCRLDFNTRDAAQVFYLRQQNNDKASRRNKMYAGIFYTGAVVGCTGYVVLLVGLLFWL